MTAQMKAQQRFLKQLSWVPCERTERIRRSPSGDWNTLGPATWKSSTYEIFVSAFLIPVNTAWTPNLFISFNFHYFHKWRVERSEWVFINGFQFCQKSAAFIVPSPLKFPMYFHIWNRIAAPPLFSCDFGVREHEREHRRYFLKAKRTRFIHHAKHILRQNVAKMVISIQPFQQHSAYQWRF